MAYTKAEIAGDVDDTLADLVDRDYEEVVKAATYPLEHPWYESLLRERAERYEIPKKTVPAFAAALRKEAKEFLLEQPRENPAFTKADRERIAKEVARDQSALRRKKLAEAKAAAASARKEAARIRAQGKTACKLERVRAKTVCTSAADKAREARERAAKKRATRDAAALEIKDYRAIDRAEKSRKKSQRAGLAKAHVRRQESDDEVRSNLAGLDPSMLREFERVKRTIKGTPRASRTEVFLEHWKTEEDEARALDEGDAFAAGERYMREQSARRANPDRALVAMGNLIEVELVTGRVVQFPPRSILVYAPSEKRASLVFTFGAKTSRAAPSAAAAKEYERTHWGRTGPWGTAAADAPAPSGKGIAIRRIVYATKKGGDQALTFYEHDFEGTLPRLAGRQIIGGSYSVTDRGIVG